MATGTRNDPRHPIRRIQDWRFRIGRLGQRMEDYVRVFFPGHGREDGPVGEHLAFQGNFLGSEYIKMTYRPKEDFSISAYLDNHFDDFSAMAKLNGGMAYGVWNINPTIDKPSTESLSNISRLPI